MSDMTGRRVCAECQRRSKNGAQLTHSSAGMSPLRGATPGTTNEGTEPHSYHRTIQFPKAVHPKPTKESKATYIVLTFKKESGKLVSF